MSQCSQWGYLHKPVDDSWHHQRMPPSDLAWLLLSVLSSVVFRWLRLKELCDIKGCNKNHDFATIRTSRVCLIWYRSIKRYNRWQQHVLHRLHKVTMAIDLKTACRKLLYSQHGVQRTKFLYLVQLSTSLYSSHHFGTWGLHLHLC